MDPDGCLAHADNTGDPPRFINTFSIASVAAVIVALASVYVARRTQGSSPPPVGLATPNYGMQNLAGITLVCKLCIAFALPSVAAYGAIIMANGGSPLTGLADMACVIGSGFPIMPVIFASLCLLFILTNPFRLWTRHSLLACAVNICPTPVNSAVIFPASRGVYVTPLISIMSTGGVIHACDAYGSRACPDSIEWIRHNCVAEHVSSSTSPAIEFHNVLQIESMTQFDITTGSTDLFVCPNLWSTRSDVIPGETAKDREARISWVLYEAARVLVPVTGRIVAIVPFFKRKECKAALTAAGFADVVDIHGIHWTSFLPSVLIQASAATVPLPRLFDGTKVGAYMSRSAAPPCNAWRAILFMATLLVGCWLSATLLTLISIHWRELSLAIPGPPPGLPYSVGIPAMSVGLQLNMLVGVLMLLDAAWQAATLRDQKEIRTATDFVFDNSHGLQASVHSLNIHDSRPLLPAKNGKSQACCRIGLVDLLDAFKSLLFALIGSIVLSGMTWFPAFLADLIWLYAKPPESQQPLRGVNGVILAIIPFAIIRLTSFIEHTRS